MKSLLELFTSKPELMYLAIAVSVTLFLWSVHAIYQDLVQRLGLQGKEDRRQEFSSPALRMLTTFSWPLGQLVGTYTRQEEERQARTGHHSFFLVFRRGLEADLRGAGNPEGLNVEEFLGLNILSAFLGCLAGYLTYIMYPEIVVAILMGLAGIFVPRIWLSDLTKRRRKAIRKALPYALDLLTLAVEAGLDFTTALMRISDRMGNTPLANELQVLIREIQMGKIRSDALRDMADRVAVQDLSSVVSALIQTDELGAPLGPVLRIQSEFIRLRRAQEAEEMAMKAPVKLLFPLIFFIFPTAFLMILGPLFLKYFLEV